MVLFNRSTWLLVVVIVNVVSAANIDETEDSVKTSFISLLKNIVNINEKRIDAMKHIDEEKEFRLGSYLSKIHKVNEDSLEYETNQNAYLSITDMRRSLNLAFRETYTQPTPVIENDVKMVLPFKRFTFKTLNINNKKKVLKSNNHNIIELQSGYQSEPSILDNKKLKDSSQKKNKKVNPKNNDIIELPKYLGRSSLENIIAKFIRPEYKNEKKKKKMIKKDDNTIILLWKYLRRASIQDLIIKIINLNGSYQKKKNEVRQKEDIIRKLQDTIYTLKQTNTIKNLNGNIQRKIVNHNCDDDENEGDKKYEDDKKKHTCGISDEKHIKCDDASNIKPDNVDLVFTFDDGIEAEESQWSDSSYESAEGEAFSSWENRGNRQDTRKAWNGCGKSAAKSCSNACSIAHKNVCTRYKCTRKAKKAFKKECKKSCTTEFVPSKYSEERL